MADEFSPFCVKQQPSHCGPCGLSACLFMLGVDVSQRDVAWAAGKPFSIFIHGLDEDELSLAATKYGVASGHLLARRQADGSHFAKDLRRHLTEKGPALLLVKNLGHWVAVVGLLGGKFIVYDPMAESSFRHWGTKRLLEEGWNRSDDKHEEPDQYFAIKLWRRDGGAPAWRITKPWLGIHSRGSDVTAATIARDLEELVARAARHRRSPRTLERGGSTSLAQVLSRYRRSVLDAVLEWGTGRGGRTRQDLKDLYDDYVTCAGASTITFPPGTDHATLVAGLTSLFSSYWWGAKMD